MADEIKLATDTLVWLDGLKDEQIPEHVRPRMRDLIANICDFQYGFSLPLDLGLNSNAESFEVLPIERPIGPLLRWQNAFEVEASQVQSFDNDDIEKSGEHIYCLIGGLTWQTLVEEGKITGDAADEARLDTSDWLVDLFDIFAAVAESGDSALKASARRIAACWYAVAMVVSFERIDESDMVTLSKEDVMAMMGFGAGDYDDEEFAEDDEEVEGNGDSLRARMDKLALGEDGDEEDDEDYVPQEGEVDLNDLDHPTRRKVLAAALLAGELGEDDDDEDYDPTKDENDDGEDIEIADEDEEAAAAAENGEDGDDEQMDVEEAEEEETDEQREQRAEEFRARVLSSVQLLGAQWPHIEDQAWLKRVLKLMSIADERIEWFPWGVPALEPLQKSKAASDSLESAHAASILALYEDRLAQSASSPQ